MDVNRVVSSALVVGSMVGMFACGGSGGEDGPAIDASSSKVQEIVEDNTRLHTDEFDRVREFVADSTAFGDLAEGTEVRHRVCVEPEFRETDGDVGEVQCDSVSDPLEQSVRDDLDTLLGRLDAHFFADANVVSVDGPVVTYQLDGPTVCDSSRSSACARDVDASELAIEVELTGEDSLEADLRVGPEPLEPVTMHLSPNRWAFDLRLDEVQSALEHVADKTDTELYLPEMYGDMRLSWQRPEDGRGEVRWRVDSQMKIEGDTYGASFVRADPAMRLNVDRAAEEATLQLGLSNPSLRWRDSSEDDWYELSAVAVGAVASLADADRSVELRDVHLGDGAADMTLGDDIVSSFELNPDEGDAFGGTLEWTDDQIDVSADPTFEVALDMKFHRVADRIEDVAEWMRDSVTRITTRDADSAAGRSVSRSGRRGLWKMTEGTAVIESEGVSSFRHEVGGNRCLAGKSGSEKGHPLSAYEVIECSNDL